MVLSYSNFKYPAVVRKISRNFQTQALLKVYELNSDWLKDLLLLCKLRKESKWNVTYTNK